MAYREFYCECCGAKAIDRTYNQSRKYCSSGCAQKMYYRRNFAACDGEDYPTCVYNREIGCKRRKCSTCGWNPTVEAKRKEALING